MYFKGETNGLSRRGKKPHERGIVFRDFDVSRLVSVINQASIICKLFIVFIILVILIIVILLIVLKSRRRA